MDLPSIIELVRQHHCQECPAGKAIAALEKLVGSIKREAPFPEAMAPFPMAESAVAEPRTCTQCRAMNPLKTGFYKVNSKKSDGYDFVCKDCRSKNSAKRKDRGDGRSTSGGVDSLLSDIEADTRALRDSRPPARK